MLLSMWEVWRQLQDGLYFCLDICLSTWLSASDMSVFPRGLLTGRRGDSPSRRWNRVLIWVIKLSQPLTGNHSALMDVASDEGKTAPTHLKVTSLMITFTFKGSLLPNHSRSVLPCTHTCTYSCRSLEFYVMGGLNTLFWCRESC